jgi:hypothetical protein
MNTNQNDISKYNTGREVPKIKKGHHKTFSL